MNDTVSFVLELKIKDGEIDNAKALMGEMVDATKANEPSTLNYEFYASDDGATFHTYERYADSAAMMTHLGAFGEKFAERFLAIVEPTSFVVYGDPSAEVREALAPMGAVHMARFGGFTR